EKMTNSVECPTERMTNDECPTNNEGMSNDKCRMTKPSSCGRSSLVILHSSFLRHWWGIGGAFVIFCVASARPSIRADEWPQFRGPNSVQTAPADLPDKFGPTENVRWKAE